MKTLENKHVHKRPNFLRKCAVVIYLNMHLKVISNERLWHTGAYIFSTHLGMYYII